MSKSIEVWNLELASKASNTQKAYRLNFKKFLNRWEITPDELYEMRLRNLRSEDPRDHRRIESMVKSQMAEMKRSGLASSTCRMLNKALNFFFEAQGLDLKVKAKDKPKGEYMGKRMFTVEELRTLWDSPGRMRIRNRALLTFPKDSGLRVGDIAALNYEHYSKAETKLNSEGEPFKIFQPFETIKEGIIAYIRIGPEAVNALEAYLEERQENEENLKPDTPLFPKHTGERYPPKQLSKFFRQWRDRCGLPEEVSAHSFRKFHTTMLQTGGVPDTWICKLQGKSTKTAFGVYSHPEELPGELVERYMTAYNKLRIFVKIEVNLVEELRRRNEELKRGNEESKREITELAAQVAGLAEAVKNLS